jgi:hypothetical protein
MSKQVRESLVEVSFQASTYLPEAVTDNDPETRKQLEAETGLGAVPFQVTVSLGKQGLVFECLAEQTNWQVNYLAFTKDLSQLSNLHSSEAYTGTQLSDGALKESAVQYLESYGVDGRLVAFLRAYAKDKEQRLYKDWLEQMATFFS